VKTTLIMFDVEIRIATHIFQPIGCNFFNNSARRADLKKSEKLLELRFIPFRPDFDSFSGGKVPDVTGQPQARGLISYESTEENPLDTPITRQKLSNLIFKLGSRQIGE
jgi:hypothetical protein